MEPTGHPVRDRSKVVDGAAVGGAPTGGLRTGPAFGDRLERVALMSELIVP